jgi:hypothetical protein
MTRSKRGMGLYVTPASTLYARYLFQRLAESPHGVAAPFELVPQALEFRSTKVHNRLGIEHLGDWVVGEPDAVAPQLFQTFQKSAVDKLLDDDLSPELVTEIADTDGKDFRDM